jgi:hypothetical protein
MDKHEIIAALAATPSWLQVGLASLPEEAAWRAPNANEWSPAQILAHLRASDAILAPRVFQLLTRANTPLTGFDERAWAGIAARARLPLSTQLAAFEAQRAELVGVLRTLTDAEWEIVGQHETRGALSLRTIAADLAEHEREHQPQLEAALAAVRPQSPSRVSPSGQSEARGSEAGQP